VHIFHIVEITSVSQKHLMPNRSQVSSRSLFLQQDGKDWMYEQGAEWG